MSECALTTRVFSAAQRAADFTMRRGWLGEVAEQTSSGVRQHALDMTAAATEQTLNTRKGWMSITGDRCGAACKAYGNAYTSTKPDQDRKGWVEYRLRHQACTCISFPCSFPCTIMLDITSPLVPCPFDADAFPPNAQPDLYQCIIDYMNTLMPVELAHRSPGPESCFWSHVVGSPDIPCDWGDGTAPALIFSVALIPPRRLRVRIFWEQLWQPSPNRWHWFFDFDNFTALPSDGCPRMEDHIHGTYPNQINCVATPASFDDWWASSGQVTISAVV